MTKKQRRRVWGSVTEMRRGKKYVLRWMQNTPQGRRRKTKTVYGTYREACTELDRLHTEHANDLPVPTVRRAYEMWVLPLLDRRLETGTLALSTYTGITSAWRNHVCPRWGDVPITELRAIDLQEWLLTLSLGAATSSLSTLSRVFERAATYMPLPLNPFAANVKYELPRANTKKRSKKALVAAVAEMYATGTSTRKVQRVAEKMGVSRLSKDRVSAIASSLDADGEELCARPLDGSPVPYVWLDATYVKCRRGGRVASTAVVTAIGCDADGWRRVLGVDVVDTESYDSWLAFLRKIRDRGVGGAELVVSDAHPGLVRALGEIFQGAAWQRCAVHLMRDCMREAGSWQLRRRVGRIVSQVFRGRDAATVTAMHHAA